jgi:glycosyltransferase involved in cell wall biosynthesis
MVEAGAVSAARIRVVANGIDTQMYRPDTALRQHGRTALGLPDDVRLLINVGRLVPEKAQATLIDAFAQLNTGIDARLLVVGEGPERDALERRIRHHGLEERVILAGARRDIPTLLNAADLFILSSDVEGMPLALAEALACGLPAVATDAAGVAELLNDCGEIVPRGNASALAEAIRHALTHPQTDTAAQAVRRQRILSHFSLEAVAHQWLACYAQFIRPARMSIEETA